MTDKPLNYRHIAILLFFAILNFSALCASIMLGYKLIKIFSITLSATIFVFPISYICQDIIVELFGYHISKCVIWTSFLGLIIFSIFIYVLIQIPTSPNSNIDNESYQLLLGHTPRLALAIIFSLIAGDFINAIILSRLKIIVNGKWFWLRSISSSAVGEFFDTSIGFFIAFFSLMPFKEICFLAFFTYLLKMTYCTIFVWLPSLIVSLIKSKLQLNHFDYSVNYNPFRISE